MNNSWKFVLLCLVFPFVYLFITLRVADLSHEMVSSISQYNVGAILGVLLYLALKNRSQS